MLTVTPDELAARMKEYLPRVAAGEIITIVEHGRSVARLIGELPRTDAMARAVEARRVTLPEVGAQRFSTAVAGPVAGGGKPASEMITEDRR